MEQYHQKKGVNTDLPLFFNGVALVKEYREWEYFTLGKAVLAGSMAAMVGYIDRNNKSSDGGSSCGSSCGGCGGGD